MENQQNIKSATVFREPGGSGWMIEVTFGDGLYGIFGMPPKETIYDSLEHVVIALAATNLDKFTVEINDRTPG